MADPPQSPIAPVDPPIPAPTDLRIEALETMIRGLTARIEQVAIPANPPPIALNPLPFVPPRDASLPPHLPVRNRRFDGVLSIETYRLIDRSLVLRADQVASLTSYANQIRPRLTDCVFSGDSPLLVLPFLKQLVRVADQSFLSEAVLLWIVDDFLRTPAKEAFRAQSLNTWPAAVHWMLSTYASETALEAAVRKIQVVGQQAGESVRQYGSRLQLEAAALGSLMSTSEVKSLFSQGLLDPVRSLFAANLPIHELEEYTPVSVLVARAELLETGTRLSYPSPTIFGSRSQPSRPFICVEPVETEVPYFGSHAEILALTAANSKVSSEKWTCFVCYKKGHGWLECPWLTEIPLSEKEDALLRRRTYMDRFCPAFPVGSRPSSPSPRPRMSSSPLPKIPFPSQSENWPASPRQ